MRVLRKKEKGVSEVIGTILILGITVVLFSSLFYYVAVMPPPKSQVYTAFVSNYQVNQNGTFNITIINNGGESLPVAYTELIVIVQHPTGEARHYLSYQNIYNQIKNSYFKVGSSFTYHSYWDHLNATYISSVTVYLVDTQNNQVVYSNVLQGTMENVYVIGFSYSPYPFPANTTFSAHITSFVIYNQNSKTLPTVNISIPALGIKNQTMGYISPMQFGFTQSFSAISAGTYNVYINATLGGSWYNYTGLIQVANLAYVSALKITSITLQNPEPVHGSNTTIFISVYNPSNRTEKFRLNITDHFSSYPNGWSYIYTAPTGLNDPTSNFTVGPMTSVPITIPWYRIGGPYVAAGLHQLVVTFTNVTPYMANVGSSINVTVYPKIIFVGDDFSMSSSSSANVYNDYYYLFKYLNFPITITSPTSSSSVLVNISGYDFVIWVMGSSSASLGPNQNDLSNLLNQGGSLLLISNGSAAFSSLVSSTPQTLYKNTTIKYQNLTKISPNSFKEIINYTANVTVSGSPSYSSYVTFSGGIPLANFSHISSPSAIYGVVNYSANHGKFVFIGYQFASMYLYQQYYVMNKIVMWLSNISILSGVQDIALVDMKVSNPNPMFMQPVNFTFYIQNFSPGVFGPTLLEFEINGQTVPVLQNNATIPSNNIYVPPIPGNGAIIPVTVTWDADVVPGTYQIFAYVNPYHDPTEINYNNNILSSLINVNLNVRFSILVVYAHKVSGGTKNNISAVLNTLNNTVGNKNYRFINYIESNGKSTMNLSSVFQNYNLVIIDVNNTGIFDSNLVYAINKYINNPNSLKYPYSLIILGENAGYSISSNSKLENILNISSIKLISTKNQKGYLDGITYNGFNANIGPLGQNLSRGYGIIYNYNKYSTVITLKNSAVGTAIFDVNNYTDSQLNRTGNSVIENLSNVIVTIFPYDFENIIGFVQNHTFGFSPESTSSNPLRNSPPSAPQYARNFLMINFLVASRYMFNKPLPEITSPDIRINSPVVTLNNYYLFTVTMRNLGAAPVYVTLEAFEETSMYYSSQPIYLVGSTMNSITTVTATVIWKPSYASSPNPEWLRFVLVPASGQIPLSSMQEALVTQKVYFFFDNGSTLQNWNHYNILDYITGEPLFGLTGHVYSKIVTKFSVDSNYYNGQYGWVSNVSFSYPNSYYIQDIINTGVNTYESLTLKLSSVTVSPGEIITLSWEWKYSIATAQNGIFLMVKIDNTWYQVDLPYNNNPDLGNVPNVNGCNIYEVYNGQSGGGTFGWTFHTINTNDLYVMDPTTGQPETSPMNVVGHTIEFAFVYVSPYIYASSYSGSNQPGAGIYIDNVMLSETNGGNDGWRVISPGYSANQYGISTNGIQYLGFNGAPTYSLIALYNNNSGYPTFDDNLWDNLVTPVIDLYNALSATLNFTFKANIAQGLYGAGWPGDYFSLEISTNGGSTWSQIYSPPTYPSGGEYGNGGQSGGGTVYATSSNNFYPANGANSTYWLTVTVNLNFFLGLPIYLDFSMVTNDGWVNSNIFIPWHAVGYDQASSNPFLGLYMTNIYVQGYSQFFSINVYNIWT